MGQKIELLVHANRQTKDLGDLFGIFFEDLNHAVDGGIYAEMVQNRSFEYVPQDAPGYHSLTAWSKVERGMSMVKLHVETANPLHANNPHYLVMEVVRQGLGGISNCGYNSGMRAQKNERYFFSCWYRLKSSKPAAIQVRLESSDGRICYAQKSFTACKSNWQKAELVLESNADDTSARLVIGCMEPVSIALDMVSLFPEHTFRGRRNGLRADLAQMLADMKPKFLRFPGGCLVHGGSLDSNDHESMYRWKKTLGPVEQRPNWRNIWTHTQTLGLGFYEYFLLSEDIGAQPLPVIPAGVDPHSLLAAPLESMQEWIDEALDLIEFANGSPDTPWGKVRAEMGHPEPFHLKYLAIGNEEVGEEFCERYEIIHRAVQAKYPEIQLVGSAGPGNAGEVFEHGWQHARSLGADYVDEHYYQSPDWFIANMHRYDSYSPDGTKAFLGEYASRDDKWWNALVEGAFMIGMEKAPGVGLACYAPLFCNADYINWKPDMIWFNNHQVYGTPSYHVQKLMMANQGDCEVSIDQHGGQMQYAVPTTTDGEIAFFTDESDIQIADVVITNLDTQEEIHLDHLHLNKEHPEHLLCCVDWKNYRIAFAALRSHDLDERHYAGARPFVLEFGRKNEDNKIRWIIDGWTNLASIAQSREGEFCELTGYFPEYKHAQWQVYSLEVRAGVITPSVDGKAYPSAMIAQPDIEPLYASASTESASGDLIIKVANLQKQAADVSLTLEDYLPRTVTVHEMSGFLRGDCNTFEEPDKVSPRTYAKDALASMEWVFPPESFTILHFQK